MIDQILGKPSSGWKRGQIILVLAFWWLQLRNRNGPRILRKYGYSLARYTPWQLIVGCFTCVYFLRNLPAILGLSSPEPLERLYSRNYYRATWINTALDAGFATALHLRPKFIRDLFSMLFSVYYLLYANEAEEKLRRYRALSTVEFLRATWEKQSNPYIRALTYFDRPAIKIMKKFELPRPRGSPYTQSISATLFYDGSAPHLKKCKELILDFPGGGFICMSPLNHEERLRRWARATKKPILSIDYSKAPEFPYPFAIHESLDVYRLLHDTKGRIIGLEQDEIHIIMTGDSAGANLATAVVYKVLEMPEAVRLPSPVALVFAYPALDFNFGSWMSPNHLKVLRQESLASFKGIAEQKDHFSHASPLAVVNDRKVKRKRSWTKSFSRLPFVGSGRSDGAKTPKSPRTPAVPDDQYSVTDVEDTGYQSSEDEAGKVVTRQKSLSDRVQYWEQGTDEELAAYPAVTPAWERPPAKFVLGTRLTMTSRSACFGDRILSAPMMRSMALCYIGPRNCPDLSSNYYISPILASDALLSQLPPVYLITGEKDPLSDDTIIFAGRIREAKQARKSEALAKINKHGKALAMSSSGDDPIVEESEEDWIHMRIIEGWSHGFLQMVTLLPAVEEPIALMADWIDSAFHHARAKYVNKQPAEDKDAETDVLSFTTRPRLTSTSRTASPSPMNSSSSIPVSASRDSFAISSSSSSDEALSPNGRRHAVAQRAVSDASQDGTQGRTQEPRRGSNKGPAFVDAASILQRRREEAVFGLQTPQKSPMKEKEEKEALHVAHSNHTDATSS